MRQGSESNDTIRKAARAFEEALPAEQRKRLGQFFTGIQLGKLLAHLALQPDTRTVLDPMAGHGDLLDATCEAARERGIKLKRLDGVEIESATATVCKDRISAICKEHGTVLQQIVTGSAFDLQLLEILPECSYDLVITNPPYVRYQAGNENGAQTDIVRNGLLKIADRQIPESGRDMWRTLVGSYSGLADLSVPAWFLASLMVRPGGRLALVVPATWRSRDYADVIRYLLLRCFSVEVVVEDTQPGWFCDALVRTHLIVAKRLHPNEEREKLGKRGTWTPARWIQISPGAADDNSLIGAAFEGQSPEANFVDWLNRKSRKTRSGISIRDFDLNHEWAAVRSRISNKHWYGHVEDRSPLLESGLTANSSAVIPDVLRDNLPVNPKTGALVSLQESGIQVGQGLRTGCNKFFYLTECGYSKNGMVRVAASSVFGNYEFAVPCAALRPVLRRQSEMDCLERNEIPLGRVLDLRGWVLPEDAEVVENAQPTYEAKGQKPPEIMPNELAAFVRLAATDEFKICGQHKRIPDLSAVRTNVRKHRIGTTTPRFWYVLPDFSHRHLPEAFVPRINHGVPWVQSNYDQPLLIDANFSTFWFPDKEWTRFGLKALLNSVWCRTFMEALGTPFGGGALKLEATHLRQLLIPRLTESEKMVLDEAGKSLTRDTIEIQEQVDNLVLQAVLPSNMKKNRFAKVAKNMTERVNSMRHARQKAA